MAGETDYTDNPRLAKQFATRKDAAAAAVAIHWMRKDATPIEVMGFHMWAIADDHMRMLTPTGYSALLAAVRADAQ